MTTSMRHRDSKINHIAEKLWYVVKEAIEAGVTPDEFRGEVRECWREARREMAEFADKDWEKKLI